MVGSTLTVVVLLAIGIVSPPTRGQAAAVVTVSVGDAAIVEGNSLTRTVVLPVTLSAALTTKLIVDYKTVGGTALAGSDFTAKTGKVTIAAGSTAGTISVVVKGDTAAESDESFSVQLTGSNNASVALGRSTGTTRIIDDEAQPYGIAGSPTVSIGDTSVVEGNSGPRTVSLALTLSQPLAEKLTVGFATMNGTATKPGDFRGKTGTTTFAAGSVKAAVSIVTVGEADQEPDEAFTVSLTTSTGPAVSFARPTATVVIFDDDLPPPTVPDAPMAPTAVLAGDTEAELGQVDVTWMPPASDGHSPITGYELQSSHDGDTWLPIASTGSVTQYRHDCGLPARSCAYRVVATNSLGSSAPSPASPVVMTQAAPERPASPTAVLAPATEALGSIDVHWAPAVDATLPVTRFDLEVAVGDGTFSPVASLGAGVTSHRHFCGVPAVACRYRVIAVNVVGRSAASEPSLTVTTPSTPESVATPSAVLAGSDAGELGAVDVSWNVPPSEAVIVGYDLEASTDLGATWRPIYSGDERSFRHQCGLPAVTCTYRVSARSGAGSSMPSGSSAPIVTQAPPSPPAAPHAELEREPNFANPVPGRVHVHWMPPATDGGAPLLGYRVEVSTDGGAAWSTVSEVDPSTTSTVHDCGVPVVTCRYRMSAVNAVDASPWSAESDAITTQGTPGPPDPPNGILAGADAENLGFVDLAWIAPIDDGGLAISSFVIEVSRDGSASWWPVATLPAQVHEFGHFCGLPAVSCRYRVSASNAVGTSAPSASSPTVTTQAVPQAPPAPLATPAGPVPDHAGLIDITWTAPAGDGDAPITGYQLQHSKDAGGTWQHAADVDGDTTSFAIACGTMVVECVYRVVALNAVGPSAASAPSNPVIGRTGPLNFIVVMTDDQSIDSLPYYMPYLDTLDEREDGVYRFDQAVTTSPLCGPSRVSFMTAMNVDHHGMNCNTGGTEQCERYAEATANSYPVWLKSVGYSTSYNGKYLNRYPCPVESANAGWPNPAGWDDWHAVRGEGMAFNTKFAAIENGTEVIYNAKSGGVPVGPQKYGTYLFGDLAEQHVRSCAEPCLTVYMPTAPHEPAVVPPDFDATNYPRPGLPERQPSWNEGCPGYDPADDKPAMLQPNITCKGPKAKSRSIDQASLQAVDREIADLIEAAKDRGVWDRTVLIFTSDHGKQHHDHNFAGKQVPYEQSVRVPLIVRIPGTSGGGVSDLVTITDVTATITDLAGAQASRPIDGRSFLPLLRGEASRRDAAYISMPQISGAPYQETIRPWFSIREDCSVHSPCYKLVNYPPSEFKGVYYGTEWELYDLTADPYELQNLMPNTITGYPGVEGWDSSAVLDLRARLEAAMINGDVE